ncbi:hypothetical protein GCM10027034_04610 [Ramlibacter solisilvae]|uniref:Uncharacterized protein n=1 Tax=Ramlibacter tataouinensis TaxID=94132 RepID=A0A127K1P4_9BURK|nr:hypothetical protein [Ramlibacter tataouinensis]AMO25092.1 hypothetical protein UC35_22510 [Ramlibacter tataouinensis]
MFSFFKKSPPAGRAPTRPAPQSRPARAARPAPLEPPPVGEVTEGNTEADWSAWESSMMELDSQMGDLPQSARIQDRNAKSSQFDDLDPFESVRKKSG